MKEQRGYETTPRSNMTLVVFDGDCSLCRHLVRWARRRLVRGPLHFIPHQYADPASLTADVPHDLTRQTVVYRSTDGSLSIKCVAVGKVLQHLMIPWPPIGWLMTLPLIHHLGDVVYDWVARNRPMLSRLFRIR